MRKIVSFILGVIFLILGLVPLLDRFNIISFSIPNIGGLFLWVLAVIGGLWLIFDGLREDQSFSFGIGHITIIVGLILLAFGLIPLLYNFGIIPFTLPAFLNLISEVIYVIAGVLLIIGGFKGWF